MSTADRREAHATVSWLISVHLDRPGKPGEERLRAELERISAAHGAAAAAMDESRECWDFKGGDGRAMDLRVKDAMTTTEKPK